MRVWFHAPMKPPTHPVPSGDRRMARLLMRALKAGGHDVVLASKLRTYDRNGDETYQRTVAKRASRIAERLIARGQSGDRPEAWLTYHLYHKAPDRLGPAVSDAFAIPYVVAEASRAPKRAAGPWSEPYAACERALARADAVLSLNAADDVCVAPALRTGVPIIALPPFLDLGPFERARAGAETARAALAARHRLDPLEPWMCAAAMMRAGDKAASYTVLAEAVGSIDAPLLIAGDGLERPAVEAMFKNRKAPTVFLGALDEPALADVYAACDLCVWPAVNEVYGMALLEAQAAGCPVVAGSAGGVPGIVADGESGILTPVGDAGAFADAVRWLLTNAYLRRRLAENAIRHVARRHTLNAAATILSATLGRARPA